MNGRQPSPVIFRRRLAAAEGEADPIDRVAQVERVVEQALGERLVCDDGGQCGVAIAVADHLGVPRPDHDVAPLAQMLELVGPAAIGGGVGEVEGELARDERQ